jgi:hypothetical protein
MAVAAWEVARFQVTIRKGDLIRIAPLKGSPDRIGFVSQLFCRGPDTLLGGIADSLSSTVIVENIGDGGL